VTNREKDRTIRTIRFSRKPSVIGRNFSIVRGLPQDYSETEASWGTIWKFKNLAHFLLRSCPLINKVELLRDAERSIRIEILCFEQRFLLSVRNGGFALCAVFARG